MDPQQVLGLLFWSTTDANSTLGYWAQDGKLNLILDYWIDWSYTTMLRVGTALIDKGKMELVSCWL